MQPSTRLFGARALSGGMFTVRPLTALIISSAVALSATLFAPHPTHFANADDRREVVRGKQVYMERCASCHGRYLQGQPLWQLQDQYTGQRASAHDQTGHTWQHADEDLFLITKTGHFPETSGSLASAMPAFKDVLDDHDMLAAIAFIKARWPVGLRVLQSMRNPDQAGMPPNADDADWTFPPQCQTTARRQPGA